MDKLTDYLRYGDVIFRGVRYPADSIRSAVDDLAAYLRREHRGNSPFVYLFAPNHVKTIVSYFATIKAGFVCVLLDPQVGRLELAEYMEDTPPGILIRINSETESLDKGAEIEFRDIRVRLKDDLEGVCTMVYTAADDGYAKAAMLTHENIYVDGDAGVSWNNIAGDSTSCALIPFYHLFALQGGVVAPALVGGTTLVWEETMFRRMKNTVDQVARYKVGHLYSVPIVFYMLARCDDANRVARSVLRAVSGGYKLSPRVRRVAERHFNVPLQEGYGLTEAGPICSCEPPVNNMSEGSVGKPFPCCEIKLRGSNQEQIGVGEIGSICVRGTNVMKGYYGHRHLNDRVLAGGWLHTGDRGYLDQGGYLHLAEVNHRPIVNVGGRNAYLPEVERIASRMPNVKRIEAHGEPHELRGGVLKANAEFYRPKQNAESELRVWMRENMTCYKTPQLINGRGR